mmetsp:Transcript_21000/g.49871  ORF Transcript_21000/g.49871 Transcript_21000/m.49871 type:complete len:121 (+) Transcript_21000:161-523(+)|eukprot:CAMPEP_0113448676 /NCGR_PEP_ID=MMETSP0014_2-20120614/4889_1 /TAXON_ID=2857 /ORGANISM="Nitzschia sp." /LENGTH=120 /DNA_ID=CAMNT_0000339895 /DNA_START=159 /DNA_END=521 /DNA_ORIENTATION=- /assembly_acc=CAM_ASM_000159
MGASGSKYSHSTNDFELAIRSSKELEHILDTELGSSGKGLHEKITSVESSLGNELIKNMRYLATIRNKLVHEHDFNSIPDRKRFVEKFDSSAAELKRVVIQRRKARGDMNKGVGESCVIS